MPTPVAVVALPVTMIEQSFRALLVPLIGAPPLLAARLLAALGAAIAVAAIAMRADVEDRVALLAATCSLQKNSLAMNRRRHRYRRRA